MVRIKHITRFLLFTLGLVLTAEAAAASIIASADRQTVYDGESFNLTFEVNGSAGGRPDFSLLEKDFDILSRNKSSSMQFINGRMNSKTQWILMLMPKRKGRVRVPPVSFGKDKSNELYINVKSAQTSSAGRVADDVFLQVEVNPAQAWVQSQILYTIRIYVAVRLNNASLSEPALSDADAVIIRLGDDRRFETLHLGRRYQVIERRYAIFPQQSGKLRIDPVVFSGQIVNNVSSLMDPFGQLGGKAKRMQSRAVEIDVKPIPTGQQGNTWLPASSLKLHEEWPSEPPEFKVGEAVTRTLMLTAEGLTAAQLPEMTRGTPDGFKAYPDQPGLEDQKSSNGITGQRVEKIAMIANRPGKLTLPGIKINWWNTKTNKPEVVRIPARTIVVAAAETTSQPVTNTEPQIDNTKPIDGPVQTGSGMATQAGGQNTLWPWISLLLAVAWSSSMFIMWRKIRALQTQGTRQQQAREKQQQLSLKQAEKRIKQACHANDAPACKQALLQWSRSAHPEQPLNSLADIGRYFGSELDVAISALNQALYSQSPHDWQGDAVWKAWQQAGQKSNRHNANKNKPELAPLYP